MVLGTAFWFGLLISISPRPLATNTAAISFLGRSVGNTRRVMMSGLLYTLGRTVGYVGLEARTKVTISSKITRRIAALGGDQNDPVSKDTLLATPDAAGARSASARRPADAPTIPLNGCCVSGYNSTVGEVTE